MRNPQSPAPTLGSSCPETGSDEVLSAMLRLQRYGPIPFLSKALEDEYKLFCAPGALVPPIWQANLFLQTFGFLQEQSALKENSTERFLYVSRSTLMVAGIIILVLDLLLIFAKQILTIRQRQASSRCDSQSPTSESSSQQGVGANLSDPEEMPSFISSQSVDSTHTNTAIDEEEVLQLNRLRYLQYLMRLVSMVILFASNIVNAVDIWSCYAMRGISPAWPHVCKIRAAVALPTQSVASHLLRPPLHWETLRLAIVLLFQTVFAVSSLNTHPIEFRYHFLVAQWVIGAMYYLACVDADRESRERFLATKVLAGLERSAELGRLAVIRTLSGLCEPSRLPQFLEGSRIRDEGTTCTVLITTIYDYSRWRQQATVLISLYCIDLWVTEVEALRKTHPGISLIEIAGDTIITASNLADASTVAGVVRTDPSEMIHFAFKQLACTRLILARQGSSIQQLRSATEITKQIGSLDVRLGLGFGPCQAEVLKGNGAFNVLHGEAFEEAKRALIVSTPQSLDLPLSVIAMCNRVIVSHGQSNADGTVRVKNVRRRLGGQASSPRGRLPPDQANAATPLQPSSSGSRSAPAGETGSEHSSGVAQSKVGTHAVLETGDDASSRPVIEAESPHPHAPAERTTTLSSPHIIPIVNQQEEEGHQTEVYAAPRLEGIEPRAPPPGDLAQRNQLETHKLSADIVRSELLQLSTTLVHEHRNVNRSSSAGVLANGNNRLFDVLPEAPSPRATDEVPTAGGSADSSAAGWGTLLWEELKAELKATAALFESVLEPHYANWLENRMQQRRSFVGLLWTTLFIAFMVPYVAQEAATPVSMAIVVILGALLAIYLLLGCRRKPPFVDIGIEQVQTPTHRR